MWAIKSLFKLILTHLLFRGNFTNIRLLLTVSSSLFNIHLWVYPPPPLLEVWTLIYEHWEVSKSQCCLRLNNETCTTWEEHLLLLAKQIKKIKIKSLTTKPQSCLRTDFFTRDLGCWFQCLTTRSLKLRKLTSKLFITHFVFTYLTAE